jgi:ferredoxin
MPLSEERIVLHIPKELVTQPLIYNIVKDFDVAVNILKATVVESEEGLMVLGLRGRRDNVRGAIRYIEGQGVRVDALRRDIRISDIKCTHCGACVGQCPTAALTLTADFEVVFEPDKCIACAHCAWACTFAAVEVQFES